MDQITFADRTDQRTPTGGTDEAAAAIYNEIKTKVNSNATDSISKTDASDQAITSNIAINGQVRGGTSTVTFSATKTFSFNDGNFQKMLITGNITSIEVSDTVNGSSYFIVLEMSGAGGYTVPALGSTFGTATDNSVAIADWPSTVGSKILITLNVETDGDLHHSIETITI